MNVVAQVTHLSVYLPIYISIIYLPNHLLSVD